MGDTTGADTDFCEQRAVRQLYNVPLTRFNMDSVNPYLSGLYTKSQLDMRRKTEILKYSANKSSTQTNNLTKQQRFALLARGRLPTPSQSQLKSGNFDCVSDQNMPTPTSHCNVPGPIINLQYDETVPLYNYSGFNTRSYPNYVPDSLAPWQIVTINDVWNDNTEPEAVFYLIINNVIDAPQHVYKVTIPIALMFSGTLVVPSSINPVTNPDYRDTRATITILRATLSVYYNGNLATTKLANTSSAALDVSFNAAGAFNASQLFGTLQFDNVSLYTQPTYVYKFAVNLFLNITSTNTRNPPFNQTLFVAKTGLKSAFVANNVTYVTQNEANGCVVVNLSGGFTTTGSVIATS